MTKEIAISIAARLCRDGMTKSSIIAAFKRSFANATPFLGELYASESIDETLIAHWLRQRTRWLKGWMQTWLFEMRHPARFLEDLGTRRFLVYHALTAGLIVSTLLYPLMLVFIAYSVFSLIVADTTVIDCSILSDRLHEHHDGISVVSRTGKAQRCRQKNSGTDTALCTALLADDVRGRMARSQATLHEAFSLGKNTRTGRLARESRAPHR